MVVIAAASLLLTQFKMLDADFEELKQLQNFGYDDRQVKPNMTQSLNVGIGIHDVTGPVGGVNMMGYALVEQMTQGIKQRLRARAFIFENNDKLVVYVSVDTGLISQNMKRHIIQKLADSRFTSQNVLLSATHTHSSIAGFNDYLLYAITSLGYVKESEDNLVDGVVGAIRRAAKSLKKSSVTMATGKLFGANINRSPMSYLANSKELRDKYEDGDTDKTMTTIKVQSDGTDRGMIAFFSVHGTSMNNTVRLVSGDNKGYASWLTEKEMNFKDQYLPYMSDEVHRLIENGSYFVAAFGQTQEGDVSPNINGSFCLDTGAPCDMLHSTCPDSKGRPRNEMCNAQGPGKNSEESTRIIGLRQYLKARQLYFQDKENVTEDGTVDYGHAWIDMTDITVKLDNGRLAKTCKAARGYSFAAGTTDGPGMFDFIQGDNSTGNGFWNFVKQFVGAKASKQQANCHLPKPILLNTGEATKPYPWEASVLDIQILRIGPLLLLGVPAEFTTMAGRLLREAVCRIFVESGSIHKDQVQVVIAGLSNSYSGYVTTFEEYQVQRYEGASTIYGPHTLRAYIQEFSRLALQMTGANDDQLPKTKHDPMVPAVDFSSRLLTFLPPVIFDTVPLSRYFGQVKVDVKSSKHYHVGETVSATFYSGHPRNVAQSSKLQLESSFASVQQYIGNVPLQQIQTMFDVPMQMVPLVDHEVLKFKFMPHLQIQSTVPVQDSYIYIYQVDGQIQRSITYPQDQNFDKLWRQVRDDDDWDTTFHWWKDVVGLSSVSFARVEWKISKRPDFDVVNTLEALSQAPSMQLPLVGSFRLLYKGAHKNVFGDVRVHQGVSSVFTVVQ